MDAEALLQSGGLFVSGAALTIIVNALVKVWTARNQKTEIAPQPLDVKLKETFASKDDNDVDHKEIFNRISALEMGHSRLRGEVDMIKPQLDRIEGKLDMIRFSRVIPKLPK